MSTKLQGVQKLYAHILRQIEENTLSLHEAVDLVSDIDPETHMGRALNELLINVSNFNLLDNYLGYKREDKVIQAFFSQETRYDKLTVIADQMTAQGEMSTEIPYAISAQVFKKTDEKDAEKYQWVIKLVITGSAEGDETVTPEFTDIEGEILPGEQVEPEKGQTSEEVYT